MHKLPLLVCILALSPTACLAKQNLHGKVISGWVERVSVHEGGVIATKAKLDTGAKTSSIHAEEIERFEKDGESWVRFTLVLEDLDDEVQRVKLEKPVKRNIRVKDHQDDSRRRPIVELPVCFDGRLHQVHFSLADRSEFIYPVLFGRRFLNDVAVVDAGETFLTAGACSP